jgi:sugar/nucleoside kinase (ribokinase family)
MSLLIVGSLAFDTIKTPFGNIDKTVGGSGAYLALSAAQFYRNTKLVSIVGNDFNSEFIQLLTSHRIDIRGVEISENKKTFHWEGHYHADLSTRTSVKTELNVLENYEPVIPNQFKGSDYLVLGNFHPDYQFKALAQMDIRPKFIALDTMNYWMDIAKDKLFHVMTLVDLICINEEEARLLTDEYSLVKAAKKIMASGVQFVIIKKGEHGALLFNREEVFYAPALPLEDVFDPTGAGDTFLGGFMGYIAHTNDISFQNLKRAMIFGSAMASFCVQKFGTQNLVSLDEQQVEDRIQDFIDLVQFEIPLEGEE